MQTLQVFSFNNHSIKVQNADDQIWFCAADVCKAIGYKNTTQAINNNVSPEYIRHIDLRRKGSKPIFIAEPGLYELIMRSTLPAAVPFQDWVYRQVLPSIRQSGTYTGQMPLTELIGVVESFDLPALIAKENSSPAQRDFKVRDVVIVNYARDDRRKAIILDFLDRYIYVKFLGNSQTDFVVASQIEAKQ